MSNLTIKFCFVHFNFWGLIFSNTTTFFKEILSYIFLENRADQSIYEWSKRIFWFLDVKISKLMEYKSCSQVDNTDTLVLTFLTFILINNCGQKQTYNRKDKN